HRDGNSILRLTDRGRIWLADADYIKSSAKFHNTLLIFRDGETSGMPPFIRRDLVSDLPHIGMSRTTTTNYAGTDWTRNIIWDKERAFIIIDEVKANSAESYSISAQWHTLGKPLLNNNTFSVSQSGEQFTIQNLNGSRLRTFTDAEMGKNWIGYKYADPVITTLQQTAKRDMRKGDKMYIINVLSANAEGKNAIKAIRANDSMLVVGTGKDRALIGVGGAKIDGLETDAKLYWLTPSRLALGGAKKLIIRNKIIFQSADSVSAEIEAGKVVFIAEKLTRVTIPASGKQLILDAAPVRAIKGKHPLTIDIPVGRHVITGIDLASEFAFGFPTDAPVEPARPITGTLQKLKEIAEFNPDNATIARPIAGDSHGLYVAGNDGIVYALTTDAKTRWKYTLGGDIRAIWTGKLTNDAPSRIVAGNAAGKIVVLDQNGKLIWQQQLPLYRSVSAVVYFTSADLSGDGNRSLIVGSDNWHHYAYDTAGSLLWEFLSIHPSSSGAAIDLDGDGKQEVIAGTQYYSWNAITPGGKQKWVINRVGPGANAVATADLSEMTKPFVYIAGADGNIYAVDADGKRPWTFNTGDGATCLELMDVDGDGKKEILTGTLNSNLFAIKADGSRLWRRDVDEPILTMVQTDLDGDGSMEIVIGTDDGHIKALTGNGKPFAEWVTSGSVNKLITLSNG
ncbi:MAG TPA: PQQ-binding-like beta-propeller repeat protein, partial [Sphingobacteriaceae bacterium]